MDLRLELDELDLTMPSRRNARRRLVATVSTAVALAMVATLCHSRAGLAGDVVKNGLFLEEKDGKPASWTGEGYVTTEPVPTRYEWRRDASSGLGIVTVRSEKPNDARWVQRVPVSPSTWYRISGWVKAENVPIETIGAYLSITDNTFKNSLDVRGTQDWQAVELWVKTGPLETSLDVACRLGGYGAMTTGVAHCTAVTVEDAGVPPIGKPYVYGGDPAEKPSAIPWGQVVGGTVILLGGIAAWWYLRPGRGGADA